MTNLFSALKYEAGEINTIHGRQKKRDFDILQLSQPGPIVASLIKPGRIKR